MRHSAPAHRPSAPSIHRSAPVPHSTQRTVPSHPSVNHPSNRPTIGIHTPSQQRVNVPGVHPGSSTYGQPGGKVVPGSPSSLPSRVSSSMLKATSLQVVKNKSTLSSLTKQPSLTSPKSASSQQSKFSQSTKMASLPKPSSAAQKLNSQSSGPGSTPPGDSPKGPPDKSVYLPTGVPDPVNTPVKTQYGTLAAPSDSRLVYPDPFPGKSTEPQVRDHINWQNTSGVSARQTGAGGLTQYPSVMPIWSSTTGSTPPATTYGGPESATDTGTRRQTSSSDDRTVGSGNEPRSNPTSDQDAASKIPSVIPESNDKPLSTQQVTEPKSDESGARKAIEYISYGVHDDPFWSPLDSLVERRAAEGLELYSGAGKVLSALAPVETALTIIDTTDNMDKAKGEIWSATTAQQKGVAWGHYFLSLPDAVTMGGASKLLDPLLERLSQRSAKLGTKAYDVLHPQTK